MHDLKDLVANTEAFKKNLGRRKFDVSIIDEISKINEERKSLTFQVETKRAEVKNISREVGELKKKGQDATELMGKVAQIKNEITHTEQALLEIEKTLLDKSAVIPNLLDDDVPTGTSEEDNKELFRKGTIKKFDFKPKEHVEIGEALGMLDFDAAAKVTGARFVFYKKQLAQLERALINFMLDQHTAHGYTEVIPPFIVHERALFGTGQLPKFKEDLFKLEGFDWYLIPTSEVPLTNLKRDELFDRKELPILVTSYTPCFRSEAGAHGKDTRGIIRQHQFNKVELVNIVQADDSKRAHDEMVKRACSILEALELPYRAMLLCSTDIGFGGRKTVDLEVWLPGQDKYREISSVSNCGDFQARRASIRYRNEQGKPEFAHTLNGSGLAVGRTLVAIMENFQNSDGSITIPAVLRPYMGGRELIKKD